ncbi:adenylate kinase [Spongiivirga citrea]|uniref:Adenylate kinase n=1 Tax=Spongiivirga citrea TaxID=1481457 RepID=A0A6M0CEG2_9FLAO|nr:adenylate kinase [Spongiivirga citrea]NER16228.1 adenylate kinase [Spongiivirga citrea]
MIQLHDKYFTPYIKAEEIERCIKKIAADIKADCGDEVPIFVGVLNGAFRFVADLVKHYDGDCEVQFIKMKSYDGLTSRGTVLSQLGLSQNLRDRRVVVLEDIVDTGNTLTEIYKLFEKEKPSEFAIASLFFKPTAYTKKHTIHYIGFEIPDRFIVGYGLDYDGLGRNLSDVYQLKATNMTNLVLFGPPGAGKGTQADVLKEKYNLVHISTGDVFRYNIKNATDLGTLAKSYMDKGHLVPDEVTIKMLNAEVDKNPQANGFIFDGFPRTEAQAASLDLLMQEKGSQVNAMIALEVDDEILVGRLMERGKTSGRPDDANEDVIRGRISVYYEQTAILKNYYQKQDKFIGVDGVGSIEEITDRLSEAIDSLQVA